MTENQRPEDNRFELIAKYKQKLIQATNIEDDPEEMTVIDNILFRLWQMGWLDALEKQDKYKWHDLRENPDDLLEEHDSIFAKYKITNTWRNSMFKKTSDEVLVCFEFDDGTRIIKQRATRDGEFVFDVYCKRTEILPKAIAWREIKPFEEEESDGKSDT